MEDKKIKFLQNLSEVAGIIYLACEKSGITRSTYYRWYNSDESFQRAVGDVMEAQIDFVESKLINLINAGETTATIFYLKTKGKNRGWTEKSPIQATTQDNKNLLDNSEKSKNIDRKINNKKRYIIKLLKDEGKYTPDMTYQVEIAAKLLVKADLLSDEIFSDVNTSVNIEYSREGHPRTTINPKEKLYLEVLRQGQKALTALGMNTDSKKANIGTDGFTDFIESMNNN